MRPNGIGKDISATAGFGAAATGFIVANFGFVSAKTVEGAATKADSNTAIAILLMIYFFGLASDMKAARIKSTIASISALLNSLP